MESPQTNFETPEKKNQTPLIAAVTAIVLCCCCLALGAVGYYGYITIQAPRIEFQPTPETSFEVPTEELPELGQAPIGGLGNDILRNDTWQYVAAAAAGQGCDQPIGEDTTIEVLQQPTNGVWVEKWTVACASGDSYPYEVEFILDDTGATFNIKSLP